MDVDSQTPIPSVSATGSNKKWFILVFLSTIFLATYHCISGISSLEEEFLALFNMSDGEFALLSSIVFGCAIFGALLCPYISHFISLSQLMLISCILVAIGQALFVLTCAKFFPVIILFFSRALIGIAYGFQNVTVYCSVYKWFSGTKWLPFAIYIVSVTDDAGLIIAKYALLPMYDTDYDSFSLSIGLSLGILLALISALACLLILRMDRYWNSDVQIELVQDLSKVRYFGLYSWLLIIVILIPTAFTDITANLMTQPLMDIFNLSEYQSDMLLSIIPLLDISLGCVFGWFASSFGYLSYYLLCCPILYFASFCILYLSMSGSFVMAVISMVAFAFATEVGFASSFACLYLSCRPEYISILNTMVSILNLSGSMLGCFGFGLIEESEDDELRYPILMMIVFTLVLLVITVMIFVLDCMKGSEGILHLSWKEREKLNDRQSGVVNEMSLLTIPETQPLL